MSTQRNETVPRPRIREGGGTTLLTERGKTTIADMVVAKIAGMAAREVTGVHAVGTGMTRALGAVRERFSGGVSPTTGVTVEVGERQAAVDLAVIVDYGASIPDVAAGIRRNIVNKVENMCGLEVTEVNIAVEDLHLPGEEGPEPTESRVQ